MQPGGLPRGYQTPGSAGVLDFGRFNGPPPTAAGQGRPMGYPQAAGFLEETSYSTLEEDWAVAGRSKGAGSGAGAGASAASAAAHTSAAFGSYTPYMGAQPQAGFNGSFPASKPPTFPPPQPPAGMAGGPSEFGFQTDDFPALGAMGRQAAPGVAAPSSPGGAASGAARSSGHLAQPDLSRVLHAQPPPPPSQAPHVSPAQPPTPLGPPPSAPPLMSPPAPLSSGSSRSGEMMAMSEEAERAAREKYGLLGILKVIRMTDPDLNTLALGMDLTTLGLNLNSPECLYATFASPWSDTPARKDPEFYVPPCYYMNPPQLKTAHLQKFSLETLFYIFFNMPRDTLQAYAAAELYNRGWKYHRELKTWFVLQQDDEGQPGWVCFDPSTWEKHFYHQHVDSAAFLAEDDVRVKMPPPGGVPPAPTG